MNDDQTFPAGTQGASSNSGQNTSSQTGNQGQQDDKSHLRPLPPDSELGIGTVGNFNSRIDIPAHPETEFNEQYFLKMLSGSISLTTSEKKKIIETIPKLSQFQVDELIKIFEEERRKFAELDEKHQVKIRELKQKNQEEWSDFESSKEEQEQQSDDAAAVEELKKSLLNNNEATEN